MSVLYPNDILYNATVFHVIFGQLIKHDLSMSPQPQDITGRNMQCTCNDTNNPFCMVVQTPSNDKINQDESCFAIPRTTSSKKNWNCQSNFREQINKLTSWLDLSQLYGSDDNKMNNLRSNVDSGFLNTQILPGFDKHVFMSGQSGPNQCLRDTPKMPCFNSGEERTNENTALTAVQVLLLRQHNLIARQLKNLTGWTGETLFQRTR